MGTELSKILVRVIHLTTLFIHMNFVHENMHIPTEHMHEIHLIFAYLPHILLRRDTILLLAHHIWITAVLDVDQNSLEFSTMGHFHRI